MQRAWILVLVVSVIGTVLAGNAFIGPLGNTGVDGTVGAGLALLGSVSVTLLIVILIARRLPRGWFMTLLVLAMLAALLTVVAGYFLMQALLAAAMAVTFGLLVVLSLASDRRLR